MPSTDTGYLIRALYIYNFISNCTYPPERNESFIELAILDDKDLFTEVKKKYNDKVVQGKFISVVYYENISQVNNPHVLFIPKARSSSLPALNTKLASKPVLIISESKTGLANGALINFFISNNKLNYQLSTSNAKKRKIRFTTRLIQLAK